MRTIIILLLHALCMTSSAQVHTVVFTGYSDSAIARPGTLFIRYYEAGGTIYHRLAPHIATIKTLYIENPEFIQDSIPFEQLVSLKRLYVFGNDCSSLEKFPERVLACPDLTHIYHLAMTHEEQLKAQVESYRRKIHFRLVKDYGYFMSVAHGERPKKKLLLRRNWRCS